MAVMEVEIYDMLEVDTNLVGEPDAESIKLIEELGLTGQQDQVTEEGKRQPYQELNQTQLTVASILFPSSQEVGKYSKGPIPYRILKEVKAAREHFKSIQVFYPETIEKDPLLVGYVDHFYDWNEDKMAAYRGGHLIGRWGEALEPWDKMLVKAKKIMKTRSLERYHELMSNLESLKKGISDGYINLNPFLNIEEILKKVKGKE